MRHLAFITLLSFLGLAGCMATVGDPGEPDEASGALAADGVPCQSHCSITCDSAEFPRRHMEDNCEIRGGVCKGSWRCWCESNLGRKQRGSDQSGRCNGKTCAADEADVLDADATLETLAAEPDTEEDLFYCQDPTADDADVVDAW